MGELQTTTATANQLSTLNEKISIANERLRPVSDDGIASAIIKLAGAGLSFPPSIRSDGAARVYQFALRGVSVEGLRRTIVKIVQGEHPQVRDFLPTPPALAAMVKAEERELWADRERLLSTKDAMEFKRPGGAKTDEEKARVRAMVEGVKAHAAAIREDHRDQLYKGKTEDELNRMFRNKVFPPEAPPPASGKWDDDRWFQQQEENGNGKEGIGIQGAAGGDVPGDADGPDDGSEVGGTVFGFEDGGQ